MDVTGHGTEVAGVAAAVLVAGSGDAYRPRITLDSFRVVTNRGAVVPRAIVAAVRQARRLGLDVVNVSVTSWVASRQIDRAIRSAPRTAFIAAAGNDGIDVDELAGGVSPCTSGASNVVCLTAVTRRLTLAGFANYGPRSVDLAAPGEDIDTVAGARSGTSFAAPLAAGAAVLIKSVRPRIRADAIRGILTTTATRIRALSGATASGGLLNVQRALRRAMT